MRTKAIVPGLKNTQRIRVILDGIGFYTTVRDAEAMPFTGQRIAVLMALSQLVKRGVTGFGCSSVSYDDKMQRTEVQVQVDLV